MSQNGQTYFKNLAAYVSDHFETLCIKGLNMLASLVPCKMKKAVADLIRYKFRNQRK